MSQSDNNVKLIVLDRIASLRDKHQATVKDFLMDLLRALNTQARHTGWWGGKSR